MGIRLPYWFGLLIGLIADFLSKFIVSPLPVSSLRVKKFNSSSEFRSAKHKLDNFVAPFPLLDGIERTLYYEFVSNSDKKEIFFTE